MDSSLLNKFQQGLRQEADGSRRERFGRVKVSVGRRGLPGTGRMATDRE